MSALPDKCLPRHNKAAYKIINQRLVGQWIDLVFPLSSYYSRSGLVERVVVEKNTKNIFFKQTPQEDASGKNNRVILHDLCIMVIKRYRNEQHFKSIHKE